MLTILVRRPHELRVLDADPAAPGPGEVAIRVRSAGICGSDMHILHGSDPFAIEASVLAMSRAKFRAPS